MSPRRDSPEAEGGFLSRWARRKAEAREEPQAPATPAEDEAPPPAPEVEAQAEAEKTDEEILAEHGLPDPDTLVAGDDFKGFMNPALPPRLRNRALRRLWRSDPALANLDMLVDYAEDYTDAATVVPALSTAYQVGKGMVRRVVPAEDGPETAETERADAAADAETPEIDREAGPAQEPLDAEAPQAEPGEPGPEATPVAAPASRRPRPRRRMTFSFDDGEQS